MNTSTMKNITIDTSLLPHAWLTWSTKKGTFWLDCETGEKFDRIPSDVSFKAKWCREHDSCLITANSKPVWMYVKYHEDIKMLELATVTIDTTRKEIVHEWKYVCRYFIDKNKNIYNETGNIHNTYFDSARGWSFSNFTDYIREMLRCYGEKDKAVGEFQKFIGEPYYTIGNGNTVEIKWVWHIQDWYVKKQGIKGAGKGKESKLVDKLTAIPLSDYSGFAEKYPPIKIDNVSYYSNTISDIMFCERVNEEWSVLRMFKRNIDFTTHKETLKETERMYLNDNGANRIATPTENGWIPARQFKEWYNYYYLANRDEAMKICPRLKYIIPLFESNNMTDQRHMKRYLMTTLRFPELEQLIKLGFVDYAKAIAKSSYPKAEIKKDFGGYYKEKEKTLLKKVGLTKHQFDTHMSHYRSDRYNSIDGTPLAKMREYFGDDLIHLDNATFDKYYKAFFTISNRAYGFYRYVDMLDLDFNKFMKNAIRLGEKNSNVYVLLNDTMGSYLSLRTGTQPNINWYFDSYSELVRTHDAVDGLKRQQELERRAAWNAEEAERLKKMDKKREEIDKKRKDYEYEDDLYMIRLPQSGTEITNEGLLQSICIGGYVARHSEGSTNLFFLRKRATLTIPSMRLR